MLSVIWTGVSKKVFLLCLFHSQLLKHNARNFFIAVCNYRKQNCLESKKINRNRNGKPCGINI